MNEFDPIEPYVRETEALDPDSALVVRGWPLTVEGLMYNAEATRGRFSRDSRPFAAISAEVTVENWTVDAILSGPRLRTRSRYATAPVIDLVAGGFDLLATFVCPHYSIVLEPYTSQRAEDLLVLLADIRPNPHYVRRQR